MSGPVRRALRASYLATAVRDGIQAISRDKRRHVEDSLRPAFTDSIDLDEATRARHPNEPRWDYLLGHSPSSEIIAIETHSAETSEIGAVIRKRAGSLGHLRDQLGPGHRVAAWYWAASGRIDFVPHEKSVLRLSENGIEFVGGRLEARHLASLSRPVASAAGRIGRPRDRPRRKR